MPKRGLKKKLKHGHIYYCAASPLLKTTVSQHFRGCFMMFLIWQVTKCFQWVTAQSFELLPTNLNYI